MKPNQTPLYVHNLSNHPRKILENIPLSVNNRLSRISSNREVFNEAAPEFQEALDKSGYAHELNYTVPQDSPQPKNSKKNQEKEMKHALTHPGMHL